jgi:hypothetical protein
MARGGTWWARVALGVAAAVGLGLGGVWVVNPELLELLSLGEKRRLPDDERPKWPKAPGRPSLLVVAVDGVDRALLYELLRGGELPGLSALLGGREGEAFPHAHLSDALLSVLPSATLPAWASIFTGAPPGVHGVTGNEFFVRERRQLAAPAPVSFSDAEPTLAVYTDDYANRLLEAPTVYERLRAREPSLRAWVAMSQFYRGADRLLFAKRTVLAAAFGAFVEELVEGGKASRRVYEELDEEVLDNVIDEARRAELPDVLTVYLSGNDLYAHEAEEGPDRARRDYLREVLDRKLGALAAALAARGGLDDRFVVVVSDHGHTAVVYDEAHALATDAATDPPAPLRAAGFRLRPFELEVDDGADFQAVLAYNGAMAYVYLADRSGCSAEGQRCDWARPPRFEADVLAAAEAFFAANAAPAGPLAGTLDLVLARRPRPYAEADEPFAVYQGGGRLEPLGAYLAHSPRPEYVDLEARLAELATGPHGERAGDVLLLAHNGDRDAPEGRYYFSHRYRSWHGSPSYKDSEVPLVVAHRGRSADELGRLVRRALGDRPTQPRVTDLLLTLRQGDDGRAPP